MPSAQRPGARANIAASGAVGGGVGPRPLRRKVAAKRITTGEAPQYILDEKQTLLVTGTGGMRIYGAQKEYRWFPREGFFVRSPTRIDGVAIGDAERRREEDRYLMRERAREKARAERRKDNPDAAADGATPEGVGDFLRQTVEPEFVSSAYFLRFKFDEGHYALSAARS